jgi:predicted ATPase/transcriptional regulator with XRE-family HTH domain
MDGHSASFGGRLRQFRLRAGLSQAELAERANLSPSAVTTLERGVRSLPYPRTVDALAEALGLTAAEHADLVAAAQRSARLRQEGPRVAKRLPVPVRLPIWLTSFVGREADVEAVCALLAPNGSAVRLLTLLGPGGVGKTRLAVAAAAALSPAFTDGVVFVDLAPLRDARLVPATIARALGLREGGGRSARDLLLQDLRERQLLVVLDNFEHLPGALALVSELPRRCPRVALLVTSRSPLRVQGEQRFTVAPLATPRLLPGGAARQDVNASPAVQLFLARAQAMVAGFVLTDSNAQAVAGICRRLEGLPLAIELAAARVPLLSPDALLRRLEQRLSLLTGGAADLPERQQTLRRTVAWSYDQLETAQQALFRRLAVFAGGWTLESAQAVCTGANPSAQDVLDGLQVLVDNSLVRRFEDLDAEPRFGMLDTIREYAGEELRDSGELDSSRSRHAEFYARLAEPLDAAAAWGRSPAPLLGDRALDRIEADLDNVVAALDWWLTTGRVVEGLRLAVAANWSWSRRGQYTAGRHWLEAMLELADRSASPAAFRAERAVALTEAGTLAGYQGDKEHARAFFRRSVRLWRELDHAPGLALALATLGHAEWVAGDAERAVALLEEALTRSQSANVPHTVAISLRNLGLVARSQGQHARAEALFGEAAGQALAPGWYRGYSLARSLSCLGRVAALQHDLPRATTLLRHAFEVIREAGVMGQALADCLDWQAALEAHQGRLGRAVRLFGAAETHWWTSGARRYLPDEPAYAHDVADVRAALDAKTLAAQWAEGAAMDAEQAIAYALGEVDSNCGPGS